MEEGVDPDLLVLFPKAISAAEHAYFDEGEDSFDLMMRAGREAARVIAKKFPPSSLHIVCGPGNNGGDGLIIGKRLSDAGWSVKVSDLMPSRRPTKDRARASVYWGEPIAPVEHAILQAADIVVDAMFGTGFRGAAEGEAARTILTMNRRSGPTIAIDISSGVDGSTGTIETVAVRASHTITFSCLKPCHLMLPGRTNSGDIHTLDIGLPNRLLANYDDQLRINKVALWKSKLRHRQPSDHKYSFGHALVMCGSATATGAARLAAEAALSAGAGLVSIAANERASAICASQLTEVMIKCIRSTRGFQQLLADRRFTAVVLGPGMGTGSRTRDFVNAALHSGKTTILDADALTTFANQPRDLFRAINGDVILTPHDGEFARVFEVGGDRLSRVREAAKISGSVVVLKGNDTVVAAPDGRVAISEGAPPELATAGSGDVLSGIIGGLAAQGMAVFEAAAAGVWFHGEAARMCGGPLIAGDLIGKLKTIRNTVQTDSQKSVR